MCSSVAFVINVIILPETVPRTTPTPPMILITALPSPRSSEGVASGIIATTGERHVDIIKLKTIMSSISIPRSCILGIKINKRAQRGTPTIRYGVLFPKRVWVLSENLPKSGWKTTPKTLSITIIIPTAVLAQLRFAIVLFSFKIMGTYAL